MASQETALGKRGQAETYFFTEVHYFSIFNSFFFFIITDFFYDSLKENKII
jgi:hypothetical protein